MKSKKKAVKGLPIWEDPDLDFECEGREDFFSSGKDDAIPIEEMIAYVKAAKQIGGDDPYYQEYPDPIGGIGNID